MSIKFMRFSDKQINAATDDYQQAAKWSAANIQTQLNNIK